MAKCMGEGFRVYCRKLPGHIVTYAYAAPPQREIKRPIADTGVMYPLLQQTVTRCANNNLKVCVWGGKGGGGGRTRT